MSMVSYAQNREDVALDRLFPRGKAGFYIDVGANDPLLYSVTKHFYDLGWHGINVEPSRGPFAALEAARPRDVNLNVAVSDRAGELTLFEFAGILSGISTLSERHATRHREAGLPNAPRTVPTLTLSEICERYVDGPIDFLSVDVEGHEAQVLAGADWTRYRPRVVLVEATEPNTLDGAGDTPRMLVPAHDRWEPILLDAGYLFATFDGLNRFYVRPEDADLIPVLQVPVNIADGYRPYELVDLERRHHAEWAAMEALRAEYHRFAAELARLRAEYEKLERSLTSARERCDAVEAEGAAGLARMDETLAQLARIRAPIEHLARRYPRAVSSVKGAIRRGMQRGGSPS